MPPVDSMDGYLLVYFFAQIQTRKLPGTQPGAEGTAPALASQLETSLQVIGFAKLRSIEHQITMNMALMHALISARHL